MAAGLNAGGNAAIDSVSCAAAGSCSAGGSYADSSLRIQAFVVNEANGTWRQAKEVAANLNSGVGNGASVDSVSCAAAGSCSAGGFYTSSAGPLEAFVVNEANGSWGRAKEVAANLNKGGEAEITSMSCATAGNCSAGGAYIDRSGNVQAFVINETGGIWGTAIEVAAALNTAGFAEISSVSCATAGNCSAGGFYHSSGTQQAFVINETNGSWGRAKEVAANLNATGEAAIHSVSCAAAGSCSAGGGYSDGSGHGQAFVVSETNGSWGQAAEVAANLNTGGQAGINSVSCAAAGNCSAGGHYTGSSAGEAFVVNQTNGSWGQATEVAANLNAGGEGEIDSVSCAAAGNCSAGGLYADSSHHLQAFVVSKP